MKKGGDTFPLIGNSGKVLGMVNMLVAYPVQ